MGMDSSKQIHMSSQLCRAIKCRVFNKIGDAIQSLQTLYVYGACQ
jgi:hypothetical protein